MRLGNPEGVRRALSDSDFDAIVAIGPENVPYVAGHILGTQKSIRERLAIVLWPKGGEPTYLVCSNEERLTREESWISDIRSYVEFKTSPIALLGEVMRERGLNQKRIAVELGYLSASYFMELQRELPGTIFVPAEQFFQDVRMIKTPDEIAALRAAAVGTERALLATYATMRVGEPEQSFRSRAIQNMLMCGADSFEFVYLNAGPNSGFTHKLAGAYQCQPGDTVRSDVGGYWGGYASDVGRTGVVGKASASQADVWAKLWEVELASIEKLRPGNSPADVYHTMKAKMEKFKLPIPWNHAGHSIGLEVHEEPVLSPYDRTEFRPNMVFSVEARTRWPGREGYQLENLFLITESEPLWLTGLVFPCERLYEI